MEPHPSHWGGGGPGDIPLDFPASNHGVSHSGPILDHHYPDYLCGDSVDPFPSQTVAGGPGVSEAQIKVA